MVFDHEIFVVVDFQLDRRSRSRSITQESRKAFVAGKQPMGDGRALMTKTG